MRTKQNFHKGLLFLLSLVCLIQTISPQKSNTSPVSGFDNVAAMYLQNATVETVLSVANIDYNSKVSIAAKSEDYQNMWFVVMDDKSPVLLYRLKNLYSSKVLSDSSDGSIIVKGEANEDSQKWKLTDAGNKKWKFENVKSGKLLTLKNGTISLATADNSASQLWYITMVNPDYAVPAPKPIGTSKYMIGAEMCNLWDITTRPDCWNQIAPYPDRKPVTGWFKEGSPEIMDWDIKMAVDHGISFFMPCWYRSEASVGKPEVKGVYDQWIDGLTKAKYKDYIKFMLIWCNNSQAGLYGGVSDKNDFINNLAPYFINHFFKNDNYFKINNKPILVIYDAEVFIRNVGGISNAGDAITKFRQMVKNAGFNDIILIADWSFLATHDNSEMKNIGIEFSAAYHWPTFAWIKPEVAYRIAYSKPDHWPAFEGTMPPFPSQGVYWPDEQVIQNQKYCWDTQTEKGVLPNLITCAMGWDSRPWGGFGGFRLTPNNFTTLLSNARTELDARNQNNLESQFLILDNWDEFGEGQYIYPIEQYGFGYLNSVRQIFGENNKFKIVLSEINKKKSAPNNRRQNNDRTQTYYNYENCMKPIWEGDTTYYESVLMEKDGNNLPQAKLLYAVDKIISVTDGTLQIEYQEGVDFTFEGNTIRLMPNSKAVYMTRDELYVTDPTKNVPVINSNTYIKIQPDTNVFYQDRQLFVTYTHKEHGLGSYVPPKYDKKLLPKTTSKLKKRDGIKILFFGDSVGAGANSSDFDNRLPFMPAWGGLIKRKLSEKYKSVIVYENPSVGGKSSDWGRENAKKLVAEKNPDVVIIAFGMGDAHAINNFPPEVYKSNIQAIMDTVKAINPNCEFILVSPMLANPEASGFSGRQAEYVAPLKELQSPGVAFADVLSADQIILQTKKFFDIGGNGVNHPNDYIYRLYAQVVSALLIK